MENKQFKNNSNGKGKICKILSGLKSEFDVEVPKRENAFLTLSRTILSQNTNRKNTDKAYRNLIEQYSSAEEILKAGKEKIKDLIKPAGLYDRKSERIVKIAEKITENPKKDLDTILEKSPKEAREELLKFKGVGPKTADCVLLFAGGYDVMPVDTHVERVSKRLSLTDQDSNPEKVKKDVEAILPEGENGETHLLFIELGRTYCQAQNPKCDECPIEDFCPKIGIG